MATRKRIIVSGISTMTGYMRLLPALRAPDLIAVAAPLFAAVHDEHACIDVTGYLGNATAAVVSGSAEEGCRVLIRDQQLEDDDVVRLLKSRNCAAIVLNTEAEVDTDPSWIASRLEWAMGLVRVECFALDLFCSMGSSWHAFQETRDDEFTPANLETICRDFPVLLSADITLENVEPVLSFPHSQGILLTCNEITPLLPSERHAMSTESAHAIMEKLNI